MSATVLLRSSFTPTDSGRITSLLKQLVHDVNETRKGRFWTFSANDAAVSLSVVDTKRHRHDFEEVLIENDLDFDAAPEALVLSFPTRRECDSETCSLISCRLAELMDGIASTVNSK